jgi:hypothetical protein
MIKIKNGKWHRHDNELSSIDQHGISRMITKIKSFAGDKSLSHDKIRILSNILNTNELQDELMVSILDADKEDLKIIQKLKVTL